MKKVWLIFPLALVILVTLFLFKRPDSTIPQLSTPSLSPKEIVASLEIYTLGTKRIFTDPKYHNLSDEVYISAEAPSQVHVKKTGMSWADFFATLPMKLTKDCLTTGTKQVFCTNNAYKLKFFINGQENPDALDKEIKENDFLKVIYD